MIKYTHKQQVPGHKVSYMREGTQNGFTTEHRGAEKPGLSRFNPWV